MRCFLCHHGQVHDVQNHQMKNYYLFGSRVLTHVVFWLLYFLAFSLIWQKGDDLYQGFFLEFILLPARIGAVYLMIYYLLPNTLLKKKWWQFGLQYALLLLLAGLLQRCLIYFFYEANRGGAYLEIVSFQGVLRAAILVNSTIVVVTAAKVVLMYLDLEKELESGKAEEPLIEIKSERRFFRIKPSEIAYIEGMGNYIVYHTREGEKLIRYATMKEALAELPADFARIHKSYIVNKQCVKSYNNENVEVRGEFLPLGKNVELQF